MISGEAIYESALHTFDNEARAVAALADPVDKQCYIAAVEMIAQCRGRIITTGCGTSGACAKKVSQVFNCVDRASQFLNPADAPHGDYGMIRPGDIVIIISKSGKTVEMINLLPVAKARGAKIITVTENPASPIAKESDLKRILTLIEDDEEDIQV